jgi:5-amino-6-(5-phosphoribosylamino)uracil reductase
VSLDGHLDDRRPQRLVLSGPEDLDEVDALRASCDAILVGAGTVRADDPRLLVRSPERRAARVEAGDPPSPLRVILTRSGDLRLESGLFRPGEVSPTTRPLVLVPDGDLPRVRARLSGVADVAATGRTGDPVEVVDELARRGVRRVLVEGGSAVHTAFLTAGVADELRLAVAPVFVGDPEAPRFVGPGPFPHGEQVGARLESARAVGGTAVLTYLLGRP